MYQPVESASLGHEGDGVTHVVENAYCMVGLFTLIRFSSKGAWLLQGAIRMENRYRIPSGNVTNTLTKAPVSLVNNYQRSAN
jgi:hypothetical protein